MPKNKPSSELPPGQTAPLPEPSGGNASGGSRRIRPKVQLTEEQLITRRKSNNISATASRIRMHRIHEDWKKRRREGEDTLMALENRYRAAQMENIRLRGLVKECCEPEELAVLLASVEQAQDVAGGGEK